MSEQLIKAVCPNFPGDREVVETSNFERFFKVVNGKLFVPADRFIKGNFILTDKYIEAVNAFAVADLGGHNYDWDNLNTRELRDPEEIKDAIMISFNKQNFFRAILKLKIHPFLEINCWL